MSENERMPQVLVWLLLEEGGGVLMGLRKPDQKPFAGMWTLPGDVMTEDESASDTIERFARDQLGVKLGEGDFAETLFIEEAGVDYAVNIFRVSPAERPRFRESGPYQDVRWVMPPELGDRVAYPVPDALRAFLTRVEGQTST